MATTEDGAADGGATAQGDIVGVLLAAGRARRFGGDKLRAELGPGRHVGLESAAHLGAALARLVVVCPPRGDLADWYARAGYEVVVAADAARGMGHSLRAGVAACAGAAGWVIALADMPYVRPATVAAVAAAMTRPERIVIPCCDGHRGHPIGFGAAHAAALQHIEGDIGAREVVRACSDDVFEIVVDDAGILRDIDTPADLARS